MVLYRGVKFAAMVSHISTMVNMTSGVWKVKRWLKRMRNACYTLLQLTILSNCLW